MPQISAGRASGRVSGAFPPAARLVIPLVASWNMKSLNIHPTDSTTGGVFGAHKGFLLVSDGRGNVYIPTLGIDEIGTLTTGRGYQIYTDSTDTIHVTGSQVNIAATPISLQSLIWSIIAYLPQANMPIERPSPGLLPRSFLPRIMRATYTGPHSESMKSTRCASARDTMS